MEKKKQKSSLKKFLTDKFVPWLGLLTPALLILGMAGDIALKNYSALSAHSLALLFFAFAGISNRASLQAREIARDAIKLNEDTIEMCQDLQDVINHKKTKADLQKKWASDIQINNLTADDLFDK